jgi:hypothetical protein
MRKIASSANTERDAVELACRGQVAPKRFFHDDARLVGKTRRAESFDHGREQRRWDGQVMRWALSSTQCLLERLKGVQLVIIPAHILQQGEQMVECSAVVDLTGLLEAVRHLFA